MKELLFLHLDDQPERAAWIPRQFSSWIWRTYESRLKSYPEADENEAEDEFTLHLKFNDSQAQIRYLITESIDRFWELLDLNKEKCVGILLDQWVGNDKHAGSKLFTELSHKNAPLEPSILMMSAYPAEMCEDLGWKLPHPQVLVKPAPQDEMMKWLQQRLNPSFSGEVT